jgi:glycosyltransferase involved in cell wall biosynthesis
MKLKKISIITVTYNAEQLLEKTILNILQQECKELEYIIVDGASKDGTPDIIQKYGQKIADGLFAGFTHQNFRWISEPDKGLYDAMNKGIDLATGDFVWFMNAGDKIYALDTVSKIQQMMNENPNANIFYGQSLIINKNDQIIGERHKIAPNVLTHKCLLNGLVVCHQSIIVQKSIAPRYDLHYKVAADYEWVLSSLESANEIVNTHLILSKFLENGFSSKNRKKALKERWCIMKKHFGFFATFCAHVRITIKYIKGRIKKKSNVYNADVYCKEE